MSVGLFTTEIYANGLGRKNWRGGFRLPAPKVGWVRSLKLILQVEPHLFMGESVTLY